MTVRWRVLGSEVITPNLNGKAIGQCRLVHTQDAYPDVVAFRAVAEIKDAFPRLVDGTEVTLELDGDAASEIVEAITHIDITERIGGIGSTRKLERLRGAVVGKARSPDDAARTTVRRKIIPNSRA